MCLKTCTKCGVAKPATSEHFYVRREKGNERLRADCKDCIRSERQQYRRDHPERVKESSRKSHLKHRTKRLRASAEYNERNRDRLRELGRRYHLENREKRLAYSRAYYAANRERIKKQARQYRLDNADRVREYDRYRHHRDREKILAYLKEWRSKNRERHLESNRRWREVNREHALRKDREYHWNNRETILAKNRERYRQNPEKYKMWATKRYHRVRELPFTLTEAEWGSIRNKFGERCAYCGQTGPLHKEHFIPVARGGGFVYENILPACPTCNLSKRDREFHEWYRQQHFYCRSREQTVLAHVNN